MSTSLIHSFNSAVAKYSRLNKKVSKSISKGEFWRYTSRKRHYLLHKIENLKRRISELKLQMKLAGAGLVAGMILMGTGEVAAQTSAIGPFVKNPLENPLPKPAFHASHDPSLFFWDFDKDGDLDATLGRADYNAQYLFHYQNNGTPQHPNFEEYYTDGMNAQWYGTYVNPGRPVYADIDDDGDMDLVVGMGYSDNGDPDLQDDHIYFYRNEGTAEESIFVQDVSEAHRFYNMTIKRQGWPAFTDFDKDGDMDFILVGSYNDPSNGNQEAWLQFFRNDKVGHTPGEDPTYTPLKGSSENPLYIGPSPGAGYFSVSFADLDGDGDDDYFLASAAGDMVYKRNDNGVFTEQTGPYVYKPNGASTGNPLNVNELVILMEEPYKSFAFGDLDGDGDTDLVLGANNLGTLNAPYIYVENTGNGVMDVDRGFDNPISGFSIGHNASSSLFDYDKDGDLDLFTSGSVEERGVENTTYDVIGHVYFKNDNGKFVPQNLFDEGDPFASLGQLGEGRIMIVDVDGDGDLDAITLTYGFDFDVDGYVTNIEYRRKDNNTFVLISEANSPFKDINANKYSQIGIDFADLNADGLPDMTLFAQSFAPVMYKNTGTKAKPVFTPEATWRNGLNSNYFYEPKFIDVDNDGDSDLLVGKYNNIWYYQNIGTATAPKWKEYYDSEGGHTPVPQNPFANIEEPGAIAPNLADIDGDGDKDLFFANSYEGYFTYFENQNPAPVVVATVTDITLVTKKAITLDAGLTFTDTDNDEIVRVTAKIEQFERGMEELRLNGTFPNIVSTWVDTTGVLIISGAATVLEYQNAIRNIQYIFTAGESIPGRKGNSKKSRGKFVTKNIRLTVLDADLTVATPNTKIFHIIGDDGTSGSSAPVVDTEAKKTAAKGNIAFTVNQIASDADGDLDPTTLVVTSQQGAEVTIDADGIVTVFYSSIPDFLGKDVITVTICDSGGRCTTSSFDVEVGAEPEIFTGMSPNGDGLNDWFTINYLPKETQVAIYNRWGDAVFETDDYDINDPAKRFEGKNKNGTEVIAGSYFYKIKLPNVKKPLTGYILLNR